MRPLADCQVPRSDLQELERLAEPRVASRLQAEQAMARQALRPPETEQDFRPAHFPRRQQDLRR